jgi:alpha-acetolactate decarboxylase
MLGQVRHTLYQVSTARALVEGLYEGAVQVAALRAHGDLGLGTFEGLEVKWSFSTLRSIYRS